MNILILGAGRVGSASAIQLASEQDNEVTVVDMDDERLDKLSSKSCLLYTSDAADE